jgi:hypothetical protein
MPLLVYILCAVTSLCCAGLLARQYNRRGGRLLLWSSASFACFAASNLVLFVDLVLVPNMDLTLYRTAITLTAVILMLAGLIWETT